jgi:hypothetical protein
VPLCCAVAVHRHPLLTSIGTGRNCRNFGRDFGNLGLDVSDGCGDGGSTLFNVDTAFTASSILSLKIK